MPHLACKVRLAELIRWLLGFRISFCVRENQEDAREEIEEEAGEQGFAAKDMAGEIVIDPVIEATTVSP